MAASGIGLIFEDSGTGLNDTSYIEANGSHERIRVMTTLQQAHRTTLMLLQSPNRSLLAPDAIIDFGPNNVLGTIKLHGSPAYPVAAFLQKFNGHSRTRFFYTSEGERYTWSPGVEGGETGWVCRTDRNYLVASWFPSPEDPGRQRAKPMFFVEEAFASLAFELVCTLTIMRHIVQHDIR